MLRFVLIRPGATDFDEQGRIKGSLDIPLNENGTHQVARTIGELNGLEIDHIYTSPSESARQTSLALAADRDIKIKEIELLKNLDHGLWHGKLIEEVKQKQPRLYRRWQDHPETVCPPEGESLESAQVRVQSALQKIVKRHKSGAVALVIPEPLASLVHCFLSSEDLGDMWQSECDTGKWELIEFEPRKASVG